MEYRRFEREQYHNTVPIISVAPSMTYDSGCHMGCALRSGSGPVSECCHPMFNFCRMRLNSDSWTDEFRVLSPDHLRYPFELTRLSLTRSPGFSLAPLGYHNCKPTFCRVHASPNHPSIPKIRQHCLLIRLVGATNMLLSSYFAPSFSWSWLLWPGLEHEICSHIPRLPFAL